LQAAQDRGEIAKTGGNRQTIPQVAGNGEVKFTEIGIPTQRAANTTASAVLAGVGETAIAAALGQKPDTTAQRRARAQQRAAQAVAPIDPNAEPVMMELIGLTSDGRLVQFWDKEYPVRRVNKFLPDGPWIKSGKYIIDYRGHLITCHCANMGNGNVSLQIMCNDGPTIHLPRHLIEPMLYGYVVPDEAAERKVSEALQSALAALRARDDAPSRQRGHL